MANDSNVLVRLRLLGAARFSGEAKGASAALGGIGSTGSVVQRKMGGVNKVLGTTVGMMKRAAAAGAALGIAGLAFGVKQSVNFEQAMANVQARLLTTGGNMDKLRAQALELGAKTQFSAGQAADAMGVLAQQGFSTNQIMRVLPGTLSLAAASGTDLASAAQIQTETLHGFGLSASHAAQVADVLAQVANRSAADIDDMQESLKYIAPVAKATGQNLNDVGAAIGLMSNVGIKGSQAGTTLRTALVRLSNPTDKARGALGDLGLKAGDLAGKKGLLSLPNIMKKVVKGSQGVSKNTRNAALATIFGREALSGMVALVEAGPKKFDRMSDSLEKSRGAAKRAADIMRGTVKGAWDNFTGSVETAAISLLHRFQPAMKDTLNKAAGFVNNFTKATSGFVAGFTGEQKAKQGAAPKRTPGQAMAPRDVKQLSGAAAAGDTFREKLRPAIEWIQAQMPKVGKVFVQVGKQLIDAFKPAMPFIENVLLPLLKGIAIGVISSVVAAFKVLIPIIKVTAIVLGAIGRVAAPFKGVIQGIGVVIGFIASGPILKLLSGLKYVGIAFRVALIPVRIMAGVLRVVGSAIGWLVLKWLSLHLAVLRFVGGIVTAPQRVVGAVTKLVGTIVGKIGSLAGKLVSAGVRAGGRLVSGLANGVRSRLGSLASFFGRVGKGIIDAIVNAIKSAPGALINAIKSILPGGKVGQKIAGFLGVKLATGGTVTRGGAAVVGERGPELVSLPTRSTVYDAAQTRAARSGRMASSGPMLLQANLYLSGKQIHSEVFRVDRSLQEAM